MKRVALASRAGSSSRPVLLLCFCGGCACVFAGRGPRLALSLACMNVGGLSPALGGSQNVGWQLNECLEGDAHAGHARRRLDQARPIESHPMVGLSRGNEGRVPAEKGAKQVDGPGCRVTLAIASGLDSTSRWCLPPCTFGCARCSPLLLCFSAPRHRFKTATTPPTPSARPSTNAGPKHH